ncbi:uncharacterized protein N7459_001000 [Penicillium hispanicum]|uniref:uncharacterized protein n=1 Tax=Penicillium hispanicum TaxID=1080232 RepID=UPI00254104D5|nr:uncharacterized protein N7459_001000 [Penicillium hispanicum]KAJ5594792.1 hypothetical protein N7459_001000 [Penicillium hispanicum]
MARGIMLIIDIHRDPFVMDPLSNSKNGGTGSDQKNGPSKNGGSGNGSPPGDDNGASSQKKVMDSTLVKSAGSLLKDVHDVDFEVEGVGMLTRPFIPYYCFMQDREPKEDVRPIERSAYSTSGKSIDVVMNAFPILKFPTRPVYQYEVNVVSGPFLEDDRRVIRRLFDCDARKLKLPDAIFDGHRTAWSLIDCEEIHERLIYEHGKRNPHGGQADLHGRGLIFSMLKTRKIHLGAINAWLEKKRDLDEYVIEALNFLDHLLRDWPSREYTAHKRAYFFHNIHVQEEEMRLHAEFNMGTRSLSDEFHYQLWGGATCYRGIFQMIRPSARGLLLNLDTAHAVFFSRFSLLGIMRGMLDLGDDDEVTKRLAPIPDGFGGIKESLDWMRINKKIKGVRVFPHYEGCPQKEKGFIIHGLLNTNATTYECRFKDKVTGKIEDMTISRYFAKKYNVLLQHPRMPLVQMERDEIVYPAEFLFIKGLQRWPFKLTEQQTSDMIRYTAKKPAQRLDHIIKCKRLLNHQADPNLTHYGLEIGPSMIKTKARLLPNPEIQFGNARHNPGTSARWDLRGKKFLKPNVEPLNSWAVGYFNGHRNAINFDQVQAWLDLFEKTYKAHGGVIGRRAFTLELKEDIGQAVKTLYEMTGKTWGAEPQLLVFIVPVKDSFVYLRIKKSADCRFGVPSQVLLAAMCKSNKPQYHSNVLMKVNAKLGGITNRVIPTSTRSALRPYSVIIGADVTHPMLGVWTPSLAAMCISNDTYGVSYMGGCQCNGDKVEIIREDNIRDIIRPLLLEWIGTIGRGKFPPKNIYYFRDGVSESEYKNVLAREVSAIRRVAAECCGLSTYPGKITVVVANKRHHYRAFPNPKDRACADSNGNPLPGTLIDRDVVSPHGWDFLLYSHSALQGTARPVHYKVLLDEIGHKPEELENMIYEQSYQYVRSTTPVSVHPAIYYSHLISMRARHHENVPSSAGPQSGRGIKQSRSLEKPSPDDPLAPKEKLLEMAGSTNRLPYKMWWI